MRATLALAMLLTGTGIFSLTDYVRDRAVETLLEHIVDSHSVQQISGSLTEPVLEGVVMDTSGIRISAQRIRIRWNPWRLVLAEAYVEQLQIDTAAVTPAAAPPVGDDDAESAGFALPLTLTIAELELNACEVRLTETPLTIEHLTGSIDGSGSRFRFSQLELHSSVGDAKLEAELQSVPPFTFAISGDVDARTTPLPVAATLAFSGDTTHVGGHVELGAPVTAQAQIDLDLTQAAPTASLDVHWDELALPGWAFTLGQGNVDGAGTLQAFDLQGTAAVRMPGRPSAQITATARYTPGQLVLRDSRVLWSGNRIDGEGRIDISARSFTAALRTTDFALAALLPPDFATGRLGGKLSGRTRVSGAYTDTGLSVDIEQFDADGRWNDQPLAAQGKGRYTGDHLQVDSLTVRLGDNELQAAGDIGRNVAVTFGLDAPRLAALWPGAGGSARGSGHVDALLPFDGEAVIEMQALRYEELSAAQARLEVSGDGSTSHADLQVNDAGVGAGTIDTLSLTSEGSGASQALTLAASSSYGDVQARLDLVLALPVITGTLQTLTLTEPALGTWALVSPVPFQRESGRTRIAEACLTRAPTRFCLDPTDFENDAPAIAGRFEDLPLQEIAALALPQSRAHFEGTLAGDFSFAPDRQRLVATQHGGRVALAMNGEPVIESQITSLELTFDRNAARDQLALDVDLGEIGRLETRSSVEQQRISGMAYGELKDLRYLMAVFPEISNLDGSAVVNLTLGGTLDDPVVEGSAELHAPSLVLRDAPALHDVSISARAHGERELALHGEASMGAGRIQADGALRLVAFDAVSGSLHVTGGPVPVIDLPDLSVFAAPDMTLSISPQEVSLLGTLQVPTAFIRWTAVPSTESGFSNDVVIHRETSAAVSAPPVATRLDVTVELGNDVTVTGAGLDTRITGRLQLRSEPNRPPSLTGHVETVGGQYQAFGENLDITTGRLDFDGPLDNPAVDVRAGRTIDEIQVGVQLSGLFEQLHTTLYSTPPMEDAEILSYLLTGHGLSQTSDAQRDKLSDVALQLGLAKPVGFLQRTTPLDEINISDPLNQVSGALMVGKQLTPDLWVRYRYRFYQRTSALILRYSLTRSFSIQSETGDSSAVDFLFTRTFD